MILGSHNSMTYLKPNKWWMWFGKFIAKCQRVDYKKQYELGVRFFDFRISFIECHEYKYPIFSHGMMDYKGVYPDDVLEFINTKNDVYCRFVFEKGNDTDKTLFKSYIKKWLTVYPNLKIIEVKDKKTWNVLMEPNAILPCPLIDSYASCNGSYPQYSKLKGIFKSKSWSGLLIDDLWPWIYARFNNKKNLKKYKNQDVLLLMDFIEIGHVEKN